MHAGVIADEKYHVFEDIQRLLGEIRKKDDTVSPDVTLAMLAYRGSSQNQFFEALSTDQQA